MSPHRETRFYVLSAFARENDAVLAETRSDFAAERAASEVRWTEALIALLTWAPPVEARPKLHGPSAEALARGLVVGAVVRVNGGGAWRAVVLGYDRIGDAIVSHEDPSIHGFVHSISVHDLTVVLPPPAIDSWLLDERATEARLRADDTYYGNARAVAAEALRLVSVVQAGGRLPEKR